LRHRRFSGGDRASKDFEMSRTLRRDDAVFGKMPAQGVDQLRTLTHQQIARPKHHRPRLLLFSLHRNEPHRRSRAGFNDSLGIGGVVLLALYIWFDVARGNEPHLVPKPLYRAALFVGARASLHGNHTGRLSGQKREYLSACHSLPECNAAVSVRAMSVEDPLRQINADDGDVVHVVPPIVRSPFCDGKSATPQAGREGHPFHQLLRGWSHDRQDAEQVFA
jgi:hypothetical protein